MVEVMRPLTLAGTAALITSVLVLSGCAQAEEELRSQIRASCDRAVTSAQDSGALGRAGNGAGRLRDELTSGIDEKYRAPMEDVVNQLPTEAAKRGIADGVNKAVPPEQRQEWHDMAVDVCTDEVAARVSLN
jgi:hypothetical protein